MKIFFKIIFILFLFYEMYISYRSYQNFNTDGDIVGLIYNYNEVLKDPFGFNIILNKTSYGGTNRYFAHVISRNCFIYGPNIFQLWYEPIESIYASFAFARTAIRFLLVGLLAVYISGKRKIWDFDFLTAAVLICPLFQIYGYRSEMGIIDTSITYTFFYAFAYSAVVLLFLPFYNNSIKGRPLVFKMPVLISLMLLVIFAAFNGPLNAPVIIIICSFSLCSLFIDNFNKSRDKSFLQQIKSGINNIPKQVLIVFSFAIVICLYSFYIGTFNSENNWVSLPLNIRYQRLFEGIHPYFIKKLGFPILIVMILINRKILLKFKDEPQTTFILKSLRLFLGMALIYLLMLPLGGYRSSRYFIIRNDTLIPVTMGLILSFGITTFHILKNIQFRIKPAYYVLVLLCLFAYVNADQDKEGFFLQYKDCEKTSLEKLASSPDSIVLLKGDCSVLNWIKTTKPEDSHNQTDLLMRWNVLKERKLYYQE